MTFPRREDWELHRCFKHHASASTRYIDCSCDFDSGETISPLAAFLSPAALDAGDNQAPAGQDAIQKVFHAKFGEGTVLTQEGVGDDARATASSGWR